MSIDKSHAAKWMLRLALALVTLALILLAAQVIAQNTGWRRDYTTKFLLLPLWWLCGAMIPLGIAGLMVTGRFKWLWLAAGPVILMALSFLAALSRFNWGM